MSIQQILTHPGGAHKDDFLACCVLIHSHAVPIVRREPTEEDLADIGTIIVDVGHEHDPERNNFDHHQFPKDSPPICALSLVLQNQGLYEDAQNFCAWLETAERFDCTGPVDTAKWLGVDRETLWKLNSPIDITLLRRFAKHTELKPGEPIWEIMRMIGEDLVVYLRDLRKRLKFIGEHAQFWTIDSAVGEFEVLFMPRTDPMPEEASSGLEKFIEEQGKQESVIAMVYPDRRGEGYGLSRFNDNKRMEYSALESSCDDVHFAHNRGFIAKTSSADPERLRELLKMAREESDVK
ncbi:MYG1 family protein [bacterium]|nr:MYG1 family protein [bacterium]